MRSSSENSEKDVTDEAAVIAEKADIQEDGITEYRKADKKMYLAKDGKILTENFSCVGDAGYERIVAPGVTHMGWQVTLPPLEALNDCILEVTAFELAEAAAGSGTAGADFCSGGLHLGADDAAGFGSEGTVLFEKTFTGVAVGEVWLCGGQSNMEFLMKYDFSTLYYIKIFEYLLPKAVSKMDE